MLSVGTLESARIAWSEDSGYVLGEGPARRAGVRSLYRRSGRKVAKPHSVAESRKKEGLERICCRALVPVHLFLSVFSCALATPTCPNYCVSFCWVRLVRVLTYRLEASVTPNRGTRIGKVYNFNLHPFMTCILGFFLHGYTCLCKRENALDVSTRRELSLTGVVLKPWCRAALYRSGLSFGPVVRKYALCGLGL